ncbi:hypothetical protein V6N12_044959 [Hibiscus sabdariffa]|uniref:Uncharacterized protein n=1 Tax=Hibiscus sabdariffa TaxID=183260 RepID=A0ABR2G1D7_9ROSI
MALLYREWLTRAWLGKGSGRARRDGEGHDVTVEADAKAAMRASGNGRASKDGEGHDVTVEADAKVAMRAGGKFV